MGYNHPFMECPDDCIGYQELGGCDDCVLMSEYQDNYFYDVGEL